MKNQEIRELLSVIERLQSVANTLHAQMNRANFPQEVRADRWQADPVLVEADRQHQRLK